MNSSHDLNAMLKKDYLDYLKKDIEKTIGLVPVAVIPGVATVYADPEKSKP